MRKKQPSPHNSFHSLTLLCYMFRPTHSAIITTETHKLKVASHGVFALLFFYSLTFSLLTLGLMMAQYTSRNSRTIRSIYKIVSVDARFPCSCIPHNGGISNSIIFITKSQNLLTFENEGSTVPPKRRKQLTPVTFRSASLSENPN